MTCPELTGLIESWAAGEIDPPEDAKAHMAVCESCAGRFALAREIHRALATPAAVPPQFTSNVLRAIRHQQAAAGREPASWWSAPLGVLIGACLGGVMLLAGDAARAIGTIAAGASPYIYVAASALVVTTLMLWQWVENDA